MKSHESNLKYFAANDLHITLSL